MGEPDRGPPPNLPDTTAASTRYRPNTNGFADFQWRPPRRKPSTLARLVSLGVWMVILVLLGLLLKNLNEKRLELPRVNRTPAQTEIVSVVAPPETPVPEDASPPPDEPTEAPPSAEEPALLSISESTPIVEDPAPAPKLVELILNPARNGNFYVEGEINRQPVVFVVDTGASAVSVPERLKWKLNLSRGRYLQSSTANGVAGMYATRIQNLSIGPIHLHDIGALLNPNAPDDVVLLGMTALREVRMVQQNGRMVLQQVQSPEELEAEFSAPEVPVKLKKSVKECMGDNKVVNEKVLRCMQGNERSEADH